jgi:hypothetical protein
MIILWRAVRADRGQALLEYTLIIFLVAVASLFALQKIEAAVMGNKVQTCRALACPSGYVTSGKTCDDPPPVCTR